MSIRTPPADLNQGSQQTSRLNVKADAKAGTASGTPEASRDTVTLTSTVAEMQKLEESLASIPDIDSARVAAIKASIAEGTYRVDSEKIVDRLLNIERELP